MSLSRQRARPAQCSIATAMARANGAVPRPRRPRQTPPDRAESGWSTAPVRVNFPSREMAKRAYIFIAVPTEFNSDIRFVTIMSTCHGGRVVVL